MAADRRVGDAEALAQLERLREVARGHAHLVAVRAQPLDHRAHHQHVRAVREVYPDAHRKTLRTVSLGRGPATYRCPTDARARLDHRNARQLNRALRARRRAAGIFALMALSSACIPIPSEVVMLFAGFAVADPGRAAPTTT